MGECEEEKRGGEEEDRQNSEREREREKTKWETDGEVSIIITGYQPSFLFFFTCPQGQNQSLVSLFPPTDRD
jgi:hypothetical protein